MLCGLVFEIVLGLVFGFVGFAFAVLFGWARIFGLFVGFGLLGCACGFRVV